MVLGFSRACEYPSFLHRASWSCRYGTSRGRIWHTNWWIKVADPMDFAHETRIRRMRILAGSVTSIKNVADPGTRGPPLTKIRGWSWLREAVCLGQGGKLSFKSLTFGPSYENGRGSTMTATNNDGHNDHDGHKRVFWRQYDREFTVNLTIY